MAEKLSASPTAIAAAGGRPARAPGMQTIELPPKPAALSKKGVLKLSARTLKVTTVVPAEQLAGLVVPNGKPQIEFEITVAGRVVKGQFNAKTLRRAVAVIGEHGVEGVVVVCQGNLVGDQLENAGIRSKGPGQQHRSERQAHRRHHSVPNQIRPVRRVYNKLL